MTLRWYLTVTMISHQGIYYRKDLEPDILNDCLHLDMLKKPMFCQLNWGMPTSYVLFTHLKCSILSAGVNRGSEATLEIPFNAGLMVTVSSSFPTKNEVSTLAETF